MAFALSAAATALAAAAPSTAAATATAATATAAKVSLMAVAKNVLMNVAITAAMSALQPQVGTAGRTFEWTLDPNAPIPFAAGRVGVAGTVAHLETYGPDKMYYGFVSVLSGAGPIRAIAGFKGDDEAVAFDGNGKAISSQWANEMWFRSRLGTQPDTALTNPPGLKNNAQLPGWTAAHKMSGKACYMLVLGENSKRTAYPTGEPKPLVTVEGLFGWDPRLDSTYPGGDGACRLDDPATWVWLDNPILWGLKWALGLWEGPIGKGAPGVDYQVGGIGAKVEGIRVDRFVAAANVADANGWKVAAYPTTDDDKSQVLDSFLQAGGAIYALEQGKISCIQRAAPRASVATVTAADTAGPLEIDTAASRIDRINTVRPRYWSEAHRWQMTAIDDVSADAYRAEDGAVRPRGIDYAYVPLALQAGQLAALQVANTRESIAGTIPLKPHMRNIAPGTAFTISDPGFLLDGLKCLCLNSDYDPMTGIVSVTFVSETDAKYPFALGQSTVAPVPPVLTPFDPTVTPPAPTDWEVVVRPGGSGGGQVPGFDLVGSVDNATATGVLVEWGPTDEGPWTQAYLGPPTVERIPLTGIQPGDVYYVAVQNIRDRRYSSRQIYGPYTAPPIISDDTVNVGGVSSEELIERVGTVENLAAAHETAINDLVEVYGDTVSAAASAASAAASASAAIAAEADAVIAQGAAQAAATDALAEATNAATSAGGAATSASAAALAAADAIIAQGAAGTSASDAAASAGAAGSAAASAATSAADAIIAQAAAGTSATAAAGSATTASTQAANASTSASQAATSATNAAGSASTAGTAASTATTAATNAGNSATAAATSATNAASSATAAGTSATAAAGSATTASTQAANASTSASQAATSATNAAGSASTAGTAATTATTAATNAGNSATAAATSATNAASSATAAGTSATAAAGSATTASTQAANASTSASQAATSATNAAGSASTAGTAATTATTAATNAGNSATAAAGSATSAATSATNAGNSATAAAASAVSAASSYTAARDAAATVLPSQFVGDFWSEQYSGNPSGRTALNSAWLVSDPTYGPVYQRTAPGSSAIYIFPRQSVQAVAGRVYEAKTTGRLVSLGGGDTPSLRHYIRGLDGAYALLTSVATPVTNFGGAPSNLTITHRFSDVAATGITAWPAGASWLTIGVRIDNAPNSTFQVHSVAIRDITAQVAAESAASASASSASAAATSATAAGTSASAASTSATNATTQAGNAATSATNASNSATTATTAANTATTQATAAATSATNAGNSATAAGTSATNAATSATAAGNSATAAQTARVAAESARDDAAGSATAAASSASSAATSATAAGSSASAASTSATNAATSAGAASTSATNASNSATTATTQASNAATSASAAATSATNAGNSATAAAGSATSAATSATNAGNSATAAAASSVSAASSYSATLAVAEAMLPERIDAAGNYFVRNTAGAALIAGDIATLAGFGPVRSMTAGGSNHLTKGYLPALPGVIYEVTIIAQVAVAGGGAAAVTGRAVMAAYDSAFASTGSVNSATTPIVGVGTIVTITRRFGAAAPPGGTAWTAGAVWLRAGLLAQGDAATTIYVRSVSIQDVTALVANEASAAAAATSASSAATSATNAGTSATAASGSATTASTQAANASTFASQASTSATGAAGSATAAASSATAAGTSASTAATAATTATTQASNASASAAAAAVSATVAASIQTRALSLNPRFADYPTTPGIPTSWADWASGSTGVRVANPSGGYGYQLASALNTNAGIRQNAPAASTVQDGYYVLDAEFRLDSGGLSGAGVQVRFYDDSLTTIAQTEQIYFKNEPAIGDVAAPGAGVVGRTYRYSKLIKATAAGGTRPQLRAANSNSDFGESRVAKTLTWFQCSIRPATSAEIEAGVALPALSATVAAHSAALVNLETGYAEARLEFVANTSGGAARFRLASTSHGTIAGLDADEIYFGDNTYFDDATDTLITNNGAGKRTIQMGPFGSDALIFWQGADTVAPGAATIANSDRSIAANGKSYVNGKRQQEAYTETASAVPASVAAAWADVLTFALPAGPTTLDSYHARMGLEIQLAPSRTRSSSGTVAPAGEWTIVEQDSVGTTATERVVSSGTWSTTIVGAGGNATHVTDWSINADVGTPWTDISREWPFKFGGGGRFVVRMRQVGTANLITPIVNLQLSVTRYG